MAQLEAFLINPSPKCSSPHFNFVSALPPETAARDTRAFAPLPARYFTPVRSSNLADSHHEQELEAALQEMPLRMEAA